MGPIKSIRRKLGLNRGALISRLPLHWQYVLQYKSAHKHWCLLFHPQTFNQKIFYKKIYDRRPILVTFADKLPAREYVRSQLSPEFLVDLLVCTDRSEDIDFTQLPSRFVLKSSHGSGHIRIVKDKSTENELELKKLCQRWLAQTYSDSNGEWFYKPVTPKILIERFLDGGNGEVPFDYKLFVFNGKAFMIQVDSGRFSQHRRDLFSRDWEHFDVRYIYPNSPQPIPRPVCLGKMIEVAERLAREVDFVRVDLYEVNGKIYFGELTSTPENGGGKFEPAEFDARLGKQWSIQGYKRNAMQR